ncbi:hypothetical protein Lesp02_51890 [Lentzea sp. NBRC 105346]|uniref:hypothetical protein n=1 Tax=Lentzea sp. NBRC 105346 TaxID=3032205 RepID=UPI0024A44475|nr:hypothetical protein [Lentzea sp. NBRC 105346]GLZ33001.1 hypothetical protein Lesp02_51890 [Lentzea sp. NBRC 105346]
MVTNVSGCLVKLLLVLFGVVVGTALTAVTAVLLFLPSRSTVSSTPPSSDGPGIYVKKVERTVGNTEFELWLGPTEDRGHVVHIPAGWDTAPEHEFTPDGVRLKFRGGGEIFVPKGSYS